MITEYNSFGELENRYVYYCVNCNKPNLLPTNSLGTCCICKYCGHHKGYSRLKEVSDVQNVYILKYNTHILGVFESIEIAERNLPDDCNVLSKREFCNGEIHYEHHEQDRFDVYKLVKSQLRK